MSSTSRAGRPRASSKETLAEAACELFLEKGFESTSISDIAARAGVSRSSFFNYFASKSDILWSGLDSAVAELEIRLADGDEPDPVGAVRAAVSAVVKDLVPDTLALAIANAATMGLSEEIVREAAVRSARVARIVVARLQRSGADRITADVAGAAWGGALLSAIEAWALDGAGRTSLARFMERAMTIAARTTPLAQGGSVKQMRLVVHADDFEEAVRFYRDTAGMPQSDAHQAEGGARVVILDAGRATLELANSAQIAFIDRVETDGDAPSDPLRIALEVDDTRRTVDVMGGAGGRIEASARVTPWRSINARVRGPGGLQVTVFQELDAVD